MEKRGHVEYEKGLVRLSDTVKKEGYINHNGKKSLEEITQNADRIKRIKNNLKNQYVFSLSRDPSGE